MQNIVVAEQYLGCTVQYDLASHDIVADIDRPPDNFLCGYGPVRIFSHRLRRMPGTVQRLTISEKHDENTRNYCESYMEHNNIIIDFIHYCIDLQIGVFSPKYSSNTRGATYPLNMMMIMIIYLF